MNQSQSSRWNAGWFGGILGPALFLPFGTFFAVASASTSESGAAMPARPAW
jgi:hypothetical protein